MREAWVLCKEMIKQEHLLEMITQGNKAAGQISEFSYS